MYVLYICMYTLIEYSYIEGEWTVQYKTTEEPTQTTHYSTVSDQENS